MAISNGKTASSLYYNGPLAIPVLNLAHRLQIKQLSILPRYLKSLTQDQYRLTLQKLV